MNGDKHILIVEDEILIAKQLKKTLQKNGFQNVSISTNFDDAVGILTNNNIDLALLDIKISGEKSGIDLAEDLINLHNVPFIFLTSYNDSKTLEHIIKLKPIGYINKPVNKFTLISTIKIFFDSKRKINKPLLILKNGSKTYQINLDKLIYVKSEHIYINLHFDDNKIQVLRSSLSKFLSSINNNNILQINRSTVVNFDFVDEFDGKVLVVKNNHFKVTEKHQKTASQFFNNRESISS